VTTERTTPFLESLLTGHHSSTTTIPPIEGVDPGEQARRMANVVGGSPAPFVHVEPSETPQVTKTLGQPISVSTASAADNSAHNVQVEAEKDHILAGKDGAAGINYGFEPGKSGTQMSKESYGDAASITAPIRGAMGMYLDSRNKSNLQAEVDKLYEEQQAKQSPQPSPEPSPSASSTPSPSQPASSTSSSWLGSLVSSFFSSSSSPASSSSSTSSPSSSSPASSSSSSSSSSDDSGSSSPSTPAPSLADRFMAGEGDDWNELVSDNGKK
jgi:hypothetical protein